MCLFRLLTALCVNPLQLSVDIFTADRTAADGLQTFNASNNRRLVKSQIAYLPESGQVARILSTSEVPKDVIPEGKRNDSFCQL